MQTILFTTKKAIVIYRLISSLLFSFIISGQSFAAEDIVSFCFERTTSITEAQKSLEFLLLPREKTFLRPEDNCFDVNTSTDRSKLLEKFLSKRYTLIAETGGSKESSRELVNLNQSNCQIEFKTTRVKKVNTTGAAIGASNKAASGALEQSESSTSLLLLGLGKPALLDMEGRSLNVVCSGGVRGIYQLVFYYSEELRSKVSTEVTVKQGEVVKIANITNELNTKSKSLGFPESSYESTTGAENINYELQIK